MEWCVKRREGWGPRSADRKQATAAWLCTFRNAAPSQHDKGLTLLLLVTPCLNTHLLGRDQGSENRTLYTQLALPGAEEEMEDCIISLQETGLFSVLKMSARLISTQPCKECTVIVPTSQMRRVRWERTSNLSRTTRISEKPKPHQGSGPARVSQAAGAGASVTRSAAQPHSPASTAVTASPPSAPRLQDPHAWVSGLAGGQLPPPPRAHHAQLTSQRPPPLALARKRADARGARQPLWTHRKSNCALSPQPPFPVAFSSSCCPSLRKDDSQVLVVHPCDPSTREAEAGGSP
ncbi:PREDICTED: uncharacterized protein LOC106146389 isoform X2 [Chinchilla lanigera]|uniref:uncharacterized protein LOC106146389 isoform X2 n=1 Tax=Chinchilla lanigera TaxID=34839 RepID=UPI0006977C89|nr:PREDICTED: uncharacterized protein LOC106146389 isoform X2 [Chinchilla lanigera]